MRYLRLTASPAGRGVLAISQAFLALILWVSAPVGVYAQDMPSASDALPTITGPLALADAVQTALNYSPVVQGAGYQVSAAQARVGIARAMTRPRLSATGIAGTSSKGSVISTPPNVMPSAIMAFPDTQAATGGLMLMYPIYTGGRLAAAVKGSEALSSAVFSDRGATERNVALEAKVAYHRALLNQATVGVYKNLVGEAQERVRIADAAFREGKIAKYDLLRNQAELADAQQQLANAERDAQIALVDLKTVMGVSQGSDVILTDQLAYTPITDDLDAYMALALQKRPELAAARAKATAAGSNVDIARSAYKPQVYVTAMQGVTAMSGGTQSGFTAGISVGIPLVDAGRRRAAVREAESMLQAMKQDERQAVLYIQRDVHTVWAEMQAADKNVNLSQAAVAQAEEDYRVIKLRYEAGKAVNVEVLDALASLVRARNNELSALYEHNAARDRLARAIGEL